MDATDGGVRRRKPTVIIVTMVVALVAVVVTVVVTVGSAGRSERNKAAGDLGQVAGDIAVWVGQRGQLPRVVVTPAQDEDGGGTGWSSWTLWDGAVPPGGSVPHAAEAKDDVFVAGTVQRWCIELAYSFRRAVSFFDPWDPYDLAWVSVVGEEAEALGVRSGQCPATLGLHLSEAAPGTGSGPGAGSVVPARSAPVGTCVAHLFESPAAGNVWETGNVEVRECAGPHFGEVYHAGELPGDGFEATDASDRVWQECASAFEPFVGLPYEVSNLVWEPFAPLASDGPVQDRKFSCLIYWYTDYYALHGSARGSFR